MRRSPTNFSTRRHTPGKHEDRSPHTATSRARGRDGCVRQELAVGVAPMTNHHEEPAPLPALVWAVVFTILLVAAVAIFALVRLHTLINAHRTSAFRGTAGFCLVISDACPTVRQFFVVHNLLTNGSRKPIEPRE